MRTHQLEQISDGLSMADCAEMDLRLALASALVRSMHGDDDAWERLARHADVPVSRVRGLRRGNADDISIDALVRLLAMLGYRVEAIITRT